MNLIEGNSDAGFGGTAAELRHLTTEQLVRIARRAVVNNILGGMNIASNPNVAESVTRVIECPHCLRAVVEYGSDSLPTKHHSLGQAVMTLLAEENIKIEQEPCNHHGGELYDPLKHLQISV